MISRWIWDIREKTSEMRWREKVSYIITYYWYHILITVAVVALIILFGSRLFLKKELEFTCVIVNQEVSETWIKNIEKEFSKELGVTADRVVVDSSYQFSYDDVRLENVNESSYEKFFLKWQNGEVDAVILPESFYQHCVKMSGRFFIIDKINAGEMEIYEDEGKPTAVILGEDYNKEKVLLAFPSSGNNKEACNKFLAFIKNRQKWEE